MVDFSFVASHPALDFVNTLVLDGGEERDRLDGFEDLLGWLTGSGLAKERWVAEARARWEGTPAAARVVEEARSLRAHLRSAATALADGQAVPGLAVDALNALLRRPVRTEELILCDGGGDGPARWTRRVTREVAHPTDLLVPIAEAGADLLTAVDPTRIGRCGHPECIRFFLDTTKNRARRWCETRTCGNRANVAAYHRRQRAGKGGR